MVGYLNLILEEGNNSDVIDAIGPIVTTVGMTKIAEKPQFATSKKILKARVGQIQVKSTFA